MSSYMRYGVPHQPNYPGMVGGSSRIIPGAAPVGTSYPLTGAIASTSRTTGSLGRLGPPVRFYLTSSAPDYTPSTVRGTWTDATRTSNVYALGRTKSGTNIAVSATETNATNPTKVMLSRHISEPLHGGQITGGTGFTTLRLTQARLESDLAANMTVQIAAWISVGDSDVVREWLINPFAGATEFAATLTAFSFTLGASYTFEVVPGDRLVVELGYSAANAVTTSYTGTVQLGGTAGDLANTGTTGVTTDSPWLEMSGTNADVVFAPYVVPVPGALEDQKFLSFTSSNALTSQYHVFAEGMSQTTLGLLVELHGDNAFSFLNPDSSYYLGGDTGLRQVGKNKGYLVVSALAPDTVGNVTWWEGGTANSTYLRDLLNKIIADYPAIDRSQIWFSAFSGGSQLLTEYFLPMYSNTFFGGGAVIFGGGDEPLTTVVPFTTHFKTHFPMHWIAGEFDDGVTLPTSGFNGRAAAVGGKAYYDGQGFTGTTYDLIAGYNHDLPTLFGGLVDPYLPAVVTSTALAGGISSSSTVTGALGLTGGGVSHTLSGSISSTSTTTGALRQSIVMTGSIASVSTTTGAVIATQVLSGSVASVSTVAGALISTQVLAGTVASTSTVTGALRQTYPMTGSIASTSTVGGALGLRTTLAGSVVSTSLVTGAFAAGADALSGSVASVSTVTGSLIATGILAGSIASSSSTTGALRQTIVLSGSVASTSSTTGAFRATLVVTGSIASTSTVSGVERLSIPMAGSIASVSMVLGEFIGGMGLTGFINSTSTVTGVMAARIILSGAVTSTSTVTGAIQGPTALAGSVISTSTVTGAFRAIQVLAGSVASTSTVAGTIRWTTTLTGSVASTSTVTGLIGLGVQSYPLTGSIASTSLVTGVMARQQVLTGSVASISTTTGQMRSTLVVNGTASSTSLVTGAFVQRMALSGTVQSLSSVLANFGQVTTLSGSAISSSLVTGALRLSSGTDLNVTIGYAESRLFVLGFPEQRASRIGSAEQQMFTVGGGTR